MALEKTNDLTELIRLGKSKRLFNADVSSVQIQKAMNEAKWILEESARQGIKIVSRFNEGLFPDSLKQIKQRGRNTAPLLLYYKGNMKMAWDTQGIAVIGTRRPTSGGVKMGKHIGQYFAGEGYNIISGLALGCDTAAHKGALSVEGFTTAFVAHGLDMIHPPENSSLAEEIIDAGGALISEYPVGTLLSFQNLVERNRLQAGLAEAVILIQSDAKKGGSMHAVNTAIENGKPVFAVQYADIQTAGDPMTAGNVQLIRERKAQALTEDNLKDVMTAIDTSFSA